MCRGTRATAHTLTQSGRCSFNNNILRITLRVIKACHGRKTPTNDQRAANRNSAVTYPSTFHLQSHGLTPPVITVLWNSFAADDRQMSLAHLRITKSKVAVSEDKVLNSAASYHRPNSPRTFIGRKLYANPNPLILAISVGYEEWVNLTIVNAWHLVL